MAKPINSHTSSDFHAIINDFLEKNDIHIIKQDIDSGIINIEKGVFIGFFEIKRSFSIETRKPYDADRTNYESLYNLSQKLGTKVIVIFYEKNKIVEKGIKLFEMTGGFKFKELGIYQLKDLKKQILEIYNINFNEEQVREKGLQGIQENIYYYMSLLSNFGHTFYSEKNGRWMIVSNKKTYDPIFIYKEMKNAEKDISISDKAFISLAGKLGIPYFKFCYKSVDEVYFYEEGLEKKITLQDFLERYKKYCLS